MSAEHSWATHRCRSHRLLEAVWCSVSERWPTSHALWSCLRTSPRANPAGRRVVMCRVPARSETAVYSGSYDSSGIPSIGMVRVFSKSVG